MKRIILFAVLSLIFLISFVSADVTISTNAIFTGIGAHNTNSVDGVLFVPEVNKTLVSITRNAMDTAPFCIVFDGKTNVTIINSTWVNNICKGNNVLLTAGNLYRIGTGANATAYQYTTSSYNLAFYPGIGNFTGGCFGLDCAVQYTTSSTMYSIQDITLGNPIPPSPPTRENSTIENLTARIVYTQNFSAEGVTKNLTFFQTSP